jgi:hypothetical protein
VFTPARRTCNGREFPDAGRAAAPLARRPGKGASHFFLEVRAGFLAPVHHHSANHFVTVVSGTLGSPSTERAQAPAGSYFAFSGKKPHATRCEAGADCVLSIDARSKWDVVPQKK